MDQNKLKYFIQKHGPDILSGLATIGVGLTAILSGRAGSKITKVLSDGTERSKKEKFKATWKYYILPSVFGVGTIASIWASRKVSAAQLASMTAAVGYLASSREQIQAKLRNDEKEKVQDALISSSKLPVSFEETGKGDQLCFESYSGRWFLSSEDAVIEAENKIQELYDEQLEFTNKGFGSSFACLALNDFYNALGIQTTFFGCQMGWHSDIVGDGIFFENHYYDDEKLGRVLVVEICDYTLPFPNYFEY